MKENWTVNVNVHICDLNRTDCSKYEFLGGNYDIVAVFMCVHLATMLFPMGLEGSKKKQQDTGEYNQEMHQWQHRGGDKAKIKTKHECSVHRTW